MLFKNLSDLMNMSQTFSSPIETTDNLRESIPQLQSHNNLYTSLSHDHIAS